MCAPATTIGGINTYAYTGGNPVNFTDSTGLACDQRGCWVTPAEQAYANSGNYGPYYQTACAGDDNYACRAKDVAENRGFLSAVTNTRLANSILDNLPKGTDCSTAQDEMRQKMEAIRVGLAQAHASALAKATPQNPITLTRQQVSDFHHDVFSQNGGGDVFGGDIPGSNFLFRWCASPSCSP